MLVIISIIFEFVLITFQDPYDSYIFLSFMNGTLVLSIGKTIEEVQDTSFLSAAAPMLAVQQIFFKFIHKESVMY